MRNLFFLSTLFFLLPLKSISSQPINREKDSKPEEWQDVSITHVNRIPMRASAFAFENQALAESRKKEQSAYFQSLNGIWKFKWVENPSLRPIGFQDDSC
ncbi:MAG: hypothetical protein LBI65_02730, partial [Candidatus Symbiothrix sp.]|nr:hypothetical protein [Candidatus Symbiothrix sp.]